MHSLISYNAKGCRKPYVNDFFCRNSKLYSIYYVYSSLPWLVSVSVCYRYIIVMFWVVLIEVRYLASGAQPNRYTSKYNSDTSHVSVTRVAPRDSMHECTGLNPDRYRNSQEYSAL